MRETNPYVARHDVVRWMAALYRASSRELKRLENIAETPVVRRRRVESRRVASSRVESSRCAFVAALSRVESSRVKSTRVVARQPRGSRVA